MEIKIRKLSDIIGSGRLFLFTVFLFVAETGWLSLTSRFPMAFDEAYHFGLIQYFSHHLNPIITKQASSSYKFGAIIQDPSFLYHYLMSFPYRFIELFTKSYEVQVIGLRFINIIIAVFSLIVLRKILRAIGFSAALTNILVLAFALTPMVTALSAQINYDNLLILAVCLCVYETILCIKELDSKVLNVGRLITLLCLCLFASLVKFAFLPILVAIFGLVLWRLLVFSRSRKASVLNLAKKNFKKLSTSTKIILILATVLGSFLFTRFYIVNVVKYHSPAPQCNQILSIEDCKQYYAWNSNYMLAQQHAVHPVKRSMDVITYFSYWFLLLVLELFGEIMPLQGISYVSEPFIVIVIILASSALMCTIVNFRNMLRNRSLLAVSIIALLYLIALFARNYHDYLRFDQPVAIDGRYLIPVLIYIYALLGTGLRDTLNTLGSYGPRLKGILALVVIISFIIFGGFTQYITHITPKYGRISPLDNFILIPT